MSMLSHSKISPKILHMSPKVLVTELRGTLPKIIIGSELLGTGS